MAQDLLQEGDRFEQRRILAQAGEVQAREQMTQIELELRVQRAVERPLERRLIELDLAHILRNLCEASGIEHGERLLPDLRKGRPIRDGRIEEQIQHLPRSLEIPGRLRHGLRGRNLGRDLGLLLVIVDQMDEGLDQVVVDLAEAMRGKTQQIQADRRDGHPLQLVDGVELDQRAVVLHAFVR